MANEYDAYRDALVVEETTTWPETLDAVDPDQQRHIEQTLHASPEEATELTYRRTHTGFEREITVTEADLTRVS